ncbi:MAG: hypothetical protein HRT47_00090 [Candidatus Caenarcaniphilales bacterium]|nr:hypothetical protein [Candidatus Caenarcaniphilales bacterium]
MGTKINRSFVLIALVILLSSLSNACANLEKKKYDFREDIPSGLLSGTMFPSEGDASKAQDIKVNMFPMDVQYKQGVGVIDISNRSYKFNWESDSVLDANTWNISFSKDNNLYASLNDNFSFTGILQQKDIGLELKGTITIKDSIEGEKTPYYLNAAKYVDPEIIVKGEGLTATAEEPLTLEVAAAGDDSDLIEIHMESLAEDGEKHELEVGSIKKDKNGKTTLITSIISKDFAKGDYNLYIVRSGKFKSNKIKVTI